MIVLLCRTWQGWRARSVHPERASTDLQETRTAARRGRSNAAFTQQYTSTNSQPRQTRRSSPLIAYACPIFRCLQSGHAYPCFCTPDRLAELRDHQTRRGQPSTYDRLCASHPQPTLLPRIHDADASHTPYTIRLRVPQSGTTTVRDAVRGSVRFDHRQLDDGVLLKSDGWPTYHLAVVVDDHAMGVTHVVRGEEWMTSAPKHVLLYRAFGWKLPVFAHLPLLLKPDGSKLSKRHADASVEYYIVRPHKSTHLSHTDNPFRPLLTLAFGVFVW